VAKKGKPAFQRSGPRFQPQPTILVICEDSKSSKNYLEDVKVYFRAQVQVEVMHCGKTDPAGIISEAVQRCKNYDRVFCVIDRDEHPNFERSVATVAQASKVTVVASYPCFEYWLLLHFGYSRKPYSRAGNKSPADCLIDDLKAKPGMENYAKGMKTSVFAHLTIARFVAARSYAARALKEALDVGDLNPSTRFHELILFIERLGAPLPLSRNTH
jgi:hypothetical protein